MSDALSLRGAAGAATHDGHVSRRTMLRTLVAGTGIPLIGSAAAPDQPRKGGRLRVSTQSSSTADTLDPAKGAFSTDYVRAHLFYNGLTRLDNHLAPHMELAEAFVTDDATLWTVTLRKGIQFHDGKTLSSADVVYSRIAIATRR